MAKPKIRARYRVVGPRLVKREKNLCTMDKELGALTQQKVIVEEKMWMVYFPQGHSIRVNEAELKRQGLNIKPKLVNMDTGDIVDFGGDEYDLGEEIPNHGAELIDEEPDLFEQPAPKVAKVK